jgi:hypothetical protein
MDHQLLARRRARRESAVREPKRDRGVAVSLRPQGALDAFSRRRADAAVLDIRLAPDSHAASARSSRTLP